MGLFTKKSRYWQQKLDSFTPKAPPTLAEAFQLFDHLAALSHIVHDSIKTGCEARTHLMCVELLRRGYMPRKAWIFEEPNRNRTLSFVPHGETERVWFAYHVAPALIVNAGPAQGGIIPMVMDPTLFDGPATTATWAASMGRPSPHVQVVPLGHSAAGYRGDYLPHTNTHPMDSIAFTNALTDDYAQRRMRDLRLALGAPAQRIVSSCGLREPQYHALWRTDGAVAPAALLSQAAKAHSRRL